MAENTTQSPQKPAEKGKKLFTGKRNRKWIALCLLAVAAVAGGGRCGGGGLRSFGGDRHCVRLPACPESSESEPHRCIALRLIPFCKGRGQFLTAAFAWYALRRKTEKIRSNLRLAQQIPSQKNFFNIFRFSP